MNNLSTFIDAGLLIVILGFIIKTNVTQDTKINKVYSRLDATKETVKKDFVSKDVCNIIHDQLRNDVGEIKTDVKKLLTKNGVN